MNPTASASRFPTTSWTQVRRALASREDLGSLLEVYWGPVYAYIRGRGRDRESAADLTQGFLTKTMLEHDLLARADQRIGRFRAYLCAALRRFLVDEHRRERGRRGERPAVTIPSDPVLLDAAEPDRSDDPVRAFDRQWATTVLNLTLEQVEQSCRRSGQEPHWRIYEARYVIPARNSCAPVSVETLAEQQNISEQTVWNRLNTVKRKMRDTFKAVVMQTLDDPADLEQELAELRRMLEFPD